MKESKMIGRLFRLQEIDHILSRTYEESSDNDNMLSVKEIFDHLKRRSESLQKEFHTDIHPKEEKTVRQDIMLFKDLMDVLNSRYEKEERPYEIIEREKRDKATGRMVKCYCIPAGKSFFRHSHIDWESELFKSILESLSIFDVVRKYNERGGLPEETKKWWDKKVTETLPPVVDLSVKNPEDSQFFPVLVEAIAESREIKIYYHTISETIRYKNNEDITVREEQVLPLQIKRFGNRWVLICMTDNGYILNFSFDQIRGVCLTDSICNPESRLRVKSLYKDVVGPTLPYEKSRVKSDNEKYQPTNPDDNLKKCDVIFYSLPHRAAHISAFPVMTGGVQEEIEPDGDNPIEMDLLRRYPGGKLFKLTQVYVTRELKEVLFKRMDNIAVVSPQWLREEMVKRINFLQKLYS